MFYGFIFCVFIYHLLINWWMILLYFEIILKNDSCFPIFLHFNCINPFQANDPFLYPLRQKTRGLSMTALLKDGMTL